jgi:transposase
MSSAYLTMSHRELDRSEVMHRLLERRLSHRQAAVMLGLSTRQCERLFARYKRAGPQALVSQKRGRASNRKLPEDQRTDALELVRRHYADFGPTLAHEKLVEQHGLDMSVTTLRRWMTEDGLWQTRSQKLKRAQRPRNRRACMGELVQIDGSDHEWFEDRAPRCVLLVYVDDATSALLELQFVRTESTFTYFESTRRYLARYGKPVAFYSDKATVFRVNQEGHGGTGQTQFGRAMDALNIDIICANSAAAKGRVERANKTLQDRLVKELRLRGISTLDDANAFAPEFMADHNRRFARAPLSEHNAHRPLLSGEVLGDIFQLRHQRKVSKSLTLNYGGALYVLEPTPEANAARGSRIDVFEAEDGTVSLRSHGVELPANVFEKKGLARRTVRAGTIVPNKHLSAVLELIIAQQEHETAARLDKARTYRERQLLKDRLGHVAAAH